MIKNIEISIDESILNEVETILDDSGLDLEIITKMVVKKVYKDKNIDFLLNSTRNIVADNISNQQNMNVSNENKMRKSLAISLFKSEGIDFNASNITYASKNKGAYNYWANPYITYFEADWYLILNDQFSNRLYLFYIAQGDINYEVDLTKRLDLPNVIDLQIAYNDPTFTDNRSKFSFRKFLVKEIKY